MALRPPLHRSGRDATVTVDLDGLDASALDMLGFGVIQVDSAGTVQLWSRAQAELSGTEADQALGRDFFADVLPGTDQPTFRGRFLHLVRTGRAVAGFRFGFGRPKPPWLAEIGMHPAAQPGRYWMTIRPVGAIGQARPRLAVQAANAVERRIRAEPIDPSVCEREPIHVPGAVQPHVVLLACGAAAEGFPVLACSGNVADAIAGEQPASVLGRTLATLLPPELVRDVSAATGSITAPNRPFRRSLQLGQAWFALDAHVHAGLLLLELELVADHPADFGAATPAQAQDAVSRLRAAPSLVAAAAAAAADIRAMTGFERVLVYRFDADWNGSAVGEDRIAAWDASLLGLRFPASDIPAQARALYAKSTGRFVVDRDAVPSPLHAAPEDTGTAVDLTFAPARALSPVHLEYQRNLGVNGSMSLSILVDGALWGLVIGHHRGPHYVTPETRALATLVTDAFALRVHELESARLWREQQATLAAQNRLLEQMAGSDDFVAAVTVAAGQGATLLDLFEAAGAAVVGAGRIARIGSGPDDAALRDLVAWLGGHVPPGQRVFATDHLSGHYPAAADWQSVGSGLLAAFVGDGEGGRDHVLLWLRPEVVSTVIWGGDPTKTVLSDGPTGTVLPRRSFERWVEERRGHAEPWAPWQTGIVEALAAAIEGVILRQSRRILALEAQQAALTRALEQKDMLAREIDHRVKNSLQIVANVMLLQSRAVADPVAKAAFEDTYARVMSVARVHDSLHLSDDIESVDLGQTLRQLCSDLSAGMTGAEQRLDVDADNGLMVSSQAAVALSMVATELVTNALKYAYAPGEQGEVEISLKARPAGGVELRVCDTGRGLPADWSDRAGSAGRRGGLGMRVIRAMLSQIGAEMEVRAEPPGACFTVRA